MKPQPDYTLYLVTDQRLMTTDTLEQAVEAACRGGVTLVQIREKEASEEDFTEVAQRCKKVTDRFGVGLIINDNPHVAAAIGAMGVHVGQDDTPVPEVRAIVGHDAIIGVSAHNVAEALAAREQGADYLGIGCIARTPTKPESKELSFEELDAIMEAFGGPCVAIGGVNAQTIPLCAGHPFAGYAVVSAIIAQENISAAAHGLRCVIRESAVRNALGECARGVQRLNPLVPSITNVITIDFVANAQLAAGGSAAMIYMADEGEAMAAAGQAMYLNMGSMFPVQAESMPATVKACAEQGTPWVLDPVGVGIGSQRTSILHKVKDYPPAIIRCNASEAIALADLWGLKRAERSGVRGVDSTDSVADARASAIALAQFTGGAVMVSGESDLVTDGSLVAYVEGGSELMTRITGCGCSLGGVAGVYAACGDAFTAALAAAVAYDKAGADAELHAAGPASFKTTFIDALCALTPDDIAGYPFELEEA